MTATDVDIIVAGGGAAGYFAALQAAETHPGCSVRILEKSPTTLAKVAVSGGGRCNVTHECYDPHELVRAYPRGAVELLGPFHKWQPADTMAWFEENGVELKVEDDGRVFPVTDSSRTVIECLERRATELGVDVQCRTAVDDALPLKGGGFIVTLDDGTTLRCKCLLLATGGHQGNKAHRLASQLGHTVTDPVPSLFTFICDDPRIKGLPGLQVNDAQLEVPACDLKDSGPVLITHWGLSGPAILRLSAWGARVLRDHKYTFQLVINWCPDSNGLSSAVSTAQRGHARRRVSGHPLAGIPSRLWQRLIEHSKLPEGITWQALQRPHLTELNHAICRCTLDITGRSRNKEEFVTCGGIELTQVDFRTMSSRIVPDLYFAGEVLDIDAITGGYNFQAAWTTGHLAGTAMGQRTAMG